MNTEITGPEYQINASNKKASITQRTIISTPYGDNALYNEWKNRNTSSDEYNDAEMAKAFCKTTGSETSINPKPIESTHNPRSDYTMYEQEYEACFMAYDYPTFDTTDSM